MIETDWLGFLAGAFTTAAFVPQALQVWRTRSTKDISLSMYVVFIIGVGLWLFYGVLLGSLPVIIANAVTLMLAAFVLVMKLKHG